MKHGFVAVLAACAGIVLAGCQNRPTPVEFSDLTANGESGVTTTTVLTLTFDADLDTISADDITVTGAAKGTLTGSGTDRELTITDITVRNEGEVTVKVTDPAGFTVTPAERTVTVYRKQYSVGDTGPSGVGVVFYITNDGDNGWEAAPSKWDGGTDDPTAKWKTTRTETPGTSEEIETGYENTYTAMAGVEHPAAVICRAYDGGDCDDWFLPSKDELNIMFQEKDTIGGFSTVIYWSSSEPEGDQAGAWGHSFITDGNASQNDKDSEYSVRPMRVF